MKVVLKTCVILRNNWTSSSGSYYEGSWQLIQIPFTTTNDRNSWVVICRGKNRFVEALPHRDRGHNPTSKKYFWKGLLRKEVNFVPQSWSNPASRKLMRSSPKCLRIQCSTLEKFFLLERGSGMTFLRANLSKETLFQPKCQKSAMRLVRRCGQDEREIDCAVHWNSMGPKLRNAFHKLGEKILGHGLASTQLSLKQQDEVAVLREF